VIVVGSSLLAACIARHPPAAATLRALSAVLVHAEWAGPDDVRRDFGAVMTEIGGAIVLDLGQVLVTLKINHALGIVRIAGAEERI
jgi:mRNA-degrading endonuclease HigB of HigAB toxin-antitoxin module